MSDKNFYLTTKAFRGGSISAFEQLMTSGYDPIHSNESETALWRAAEGGHEHIVARVLEWPGIDLATRGGHSAACIAIISGHMHIAQRLLSDPRVKPTSAILIHAIYRGMTSIVAMLLLDPRCKPEANNSEALKAAAWYNRNDIVKLLIDDGRVNPGDNANDAIVAAASNGNMEIMELLLADPRVDPSVNQNAALAASVKNIDVTKRLLLDMRVLRTLDPKQFPKYAPIPSGDVIMNAINAAAWRRRRAAVCAFAAYWESRE